MIGVFSKTNIDDMAFALKTLSAKSNLIAQNIANQSTPGYKSSKLIFKEVMNRYLDNDGSNIPLERTNPRHMSVDSQNDFSPEEMARFQNNPSLRNDGNDVNIDYETSQQADTEIRYSLFSDLIGKQFSQLKEIIKTR